MKTIAINLRLLFCSVWGIIALVSALLVYTFVFFESGGNVGLFVHDSFAFNVFLSALIPVISVYVVRSTKEIEYSFITRKKIIILKYLSVLIFSFSSITISILPLISGMVLNSIPFAIVFNYFLYIVSASIPQIVFISAISFGIGYLVNSVGAYILSIISSILFTPLLQNSMWEYNMRILDNKIYGGLFNLINITYDETHRIKYSGYGMPFNSETILSWLITLFMGISIVLILLLAKRSFKLRGSIITSVFLICFIVLSGTCVSEYFLNVPTMYNYGWSDIDNDYIEDPPRKVDICDRYYDENSPIITSYKMQLETGNIVKNTCQLNVSLNGNATVKLKLDACFNISVVLVDGVSVQYDRINDYFEINNLKKQENTVITVTYSGRMNYMDSLYNKSDFCDFFAGYLSELFAWYPKLLSEQNTQKEKDYKININAVNSFVSNLDDNQLHQAGNHTIEGKECEIYFYLGNISELEIDKKRMICPTEYIKNINSIMALSKLTNDLDHYTLEGLFSTYDGPSSDGMDVDEVLKLMDEWLDEQCANKEQQNAVDTVIVMPTSYNSAGTCYINENILFVSEHGVRTRCW